MNSICNQISKPIHHGEVRNYAILLNSLAGKMDLPSKLEEAESTLGLLSKKLALPPQASCPTGDYEEWVLLRRMVVWTPNRLGHISPVSIEFNWWGWRYYYWVGLGRYNLNLVVGKFQNERLTYFEGETKGDVNEPDDVVVEQTAESLVIEIDSAMASEYLLSSWPNSAYIDTCIHFVRVHLKVFCNLNYKKKKENWGKLKYSWIWIIAFF